MRSVGYAYDPVFLRHHSPGHPESRERIEAIVSLLESRHTLANLMMIPVEAASADTLARVHGAGYIAWVRELSARGGGMLNPDTYVSDGTYAAAAAAVGASIGVTQAVLRGEVERAFALVRPPGHHACAAHGEGFCVFNNIAAAAKWALDGDGGAMQRVMIVDWDVHHGNGTQAIFYADPRALYVSTHQFPLYPGTGRVGETGRGAGEGATINVPLPPGVGDAGYARVFDEIIAPAARRFQPQLILVSAGYDAHWRDRLANMCVSLAGFTRMARVLASLSDELCHGRLVAILEGGYDLDVLGYGVLNTFAVLRDDAACSIADPIGLYPDGESAVDAIVQRVKQMHAL